MDLNLKVEGVRKRESWDQLVADAGPCDHVLENRLLSEYQQPFDMPRAQALLLALRQALPTVADPVLQRSRELYTSGAA